VLNSSTTDYLFNHTFNLGRSQLDVKYLNKNNFAAIFIHKIKYSQSYTKLNSARTSHAGKASASSTSTILRATVDGWVFISIRTRHIRFIINKKIVLKGVKGKYCDRQMLSDDSPCTSNPCWNSGTCQATGGGGWLCSCPCGTMGKDCRTYKVNLCQSVDCSNRGVCVQKNDSSERMIYDFSLSVWFIIE
jgi:hypothetical protein